MDFTKQSEYVGNLAQLMPVKEYRFAGGRMDGVRAVDVSNGAGLEFTVLPDRCMDIYSVRVGGKSLNYLTPAGVVHPAYAQWAGEGWLSSFPGGFLATCGLDNIGAPSVCEGKEFSLHGLLGNTPAEEVQVVVENPLTAPVAVLRGRVRQAQIFGANLELRREIRCAYGEAKIEMVDTICNLGRHPQPMMILYHFNMGYPLLGETAELVLPSDHVQPRDEHAKAHMDSWATILPPQDAFTEMCYYHSWDTPGEKTVGIRNPAEGLGVSLTFAGEGLDHFVQWKMFEKGTYVMGLEPCNATINGRADAAANGTLKTLLPGQQVQNRVVICTDF